MSFSSRAASMAVLRVCYNGLRRVWIIHTGSNLETLKHSMMGKINDCACLSQTFSRVAPFSKFYCGKRSFQHADPRARRLDFVQNIAHFLKAVARRLGFHKQFVSSRRTGYRMVTSTARHRSSHRFRKALKELDRVARDRKSTLNPQLYP
jgi:hypothetical protein